MILKKIVTIVTALVFSTVSYSATITKKGAKKALLKFTKAELEEYEFESGDSFELRDLNDSAYSVKLLRINGLQGTITGDIEGLKVTEQYDIHDAGQSGSGNDERSYKERAKQEKNQEPPPLGFGLAFGRYWPKGTVAINVVTIDSHYVFPSLPLAIGGGFNLLSLKDDTSGESDTLGDSVESSGYSLSVFAQLTKRFGMFRPFIEGRYYLSGDLKASTSESDEGLAVEMVAKKKIHPYPALYFGTEIYLGPQFSLYVRAGKGNREKFDASGKIKITYDSDLGMPPESIDLKENGMNLKYDTFMLGVSFYP